MWAAAKKHLESWLNDADLAVVRDVEALKKLPKKEREAYKRLRQSAALGVRATSNLNRRALGSSSV